MLDPEKRVPIWLPPSFLRALHPPSQPPVCSSCSSFTAAGRGPAPEIKKLMGGRAVGACNVYAVPGFMSAPPRYRSSPNANRHWLSLWYDTLDPPSRGCRDTLRNFHFSEGEEKIVTSRFEAIENRDESLPGFSNVTISRILARDARNRSG